MYELNGQALSCHIAFTAYISCTKCKKHSCQVPKLYVIYNRNTR